MKNIPKVIHYCWFGGGMMSKLEKKCISSWKDKLPDYRIKEWNEKNFDIDSNEFVKEAYKAKKWAFVSDYARLKILYDYGDIYLDTDLEVIRNLNRFLEHNAFSGFENGKYISTAVMGAKRNHSWIRLLLSYYSDKHFIKEDGSYDMTPNVVFITNLTKKYYGVELNNTFQVFGDGVAIYPKGYFCPKNIDTGNILITDNTYAIHHFNASWWSREEHKLQNQAKFLRRAFGKRLGNIIVNMILIKKECGFLNTTKIAFKKTLVRLSIILGGNKNI